VVLSDHGQTQGATFRQRNGYGLDDLVRRSIDGRVGGDAGGDEQAVMARYALDEASRGRPRPGGDDDGAPADDDVHVLGSGNLGLIYLMESPERLPAEQIHARHPRLIPALRSHPHIGWLLVRSEHDGPLVLGPAGTLRLRDGSLTGDDPLAGLPAGARRHLLRTDGFPHAPDILVGSFYDPVLEEGCAFEELISFHGGLGGPQTQAFLMHPPTLPAPDEPLVGAEAVHRVLMGWRQRLHGAAAAVDGQASTPGDREVAPLSEPATGATLASHERRLA
jgi:hypothetical protein